MLAPVDNVTLHMGAMLGAMQNVSKEFGAITKASGALGSAMGGGGGGGLAVPDMGGGMVDSMAATMEGMSGSLMPMLAQVKDMANGTMVQGFAGATGGISTMVTNMVDR